MSTELLDQPKPDSALLNTVPPTTSTVIDDASKVNIVAPDFKEHPESVTSKANATLVLESDYEDGDEGNVNGSEKRKRRKERQSHDAQTETEGQMEVEGLWAIAKERLLQPGVAGGLLGVGAFQLNKFPCQAYNHVWNFC